MKNNFRQTDESQITITELMLPSHRNFSGKIHGGHILNLMDQIAFACASKHSGNYCVTASVNRVDFLSPIEVGNLVTMRASVNYTGRTSMVVGVRVEAEDIKTGIVKHCNSSYFTMIAKDENGKNAPVPGLILDTIPEVRRYIRSIKQKEQGIKRRKKFKAAEFNMDEHIHLLEGQNALLDLPEEK